MAVDAKSKAKLGKKLRILRESKEISQRQTALAAEITNASLSSIENGMIFPSEALLLRLVDFLKPTEKLRQELYEIYAQAKDMPPPDISNFLKDQPELQDLLRELMKKELTDQGLDLLRQQIKGMEDKEHGTAQ